MHPPPNAVDSAICQTWPCLVGQNSLLCHKNAQDFLAKLCFQNLLAAKLSFQPVLTSQLYSHIYGLKAAKLCFQLVAKLWVKLQNCNLTRNFAVLARICFQSTEFANGIASKTNLSSLYWGYKMLLSCFERIWCGRNPKITWEWLWKHRFASKKGIIFWQDYGSRIYLRQNYPSIPPSIHQF